MRIRITKTSNAEDVSFVDISSLEELADMIAELGQCVIDSPTLNQISSGVDLCIEIYDDYRE